MLLPGGLLDIRGMLDWGVFKGIPLAKLMYYIYMYIIRARKVCANF